MWRGCAMWWGSGWSLGSWRLRKCPGMSFSAFGQLGRSAAHSFLPAHTKSVMLMDTTTTIIALLGIGVALLLVIRFKEFITVRRRWHGVKVKVDQNGLGSRVESVKTKKRKKVKKTKASHARVEATLTPEDTHEEATADPIERKKDLDAQLSRAQIAKLSDVVTKLQIQYQSHLKVLATLLHEKRKRTLAGNTFARLDISDSEDENELDLSEVPLAEAPGYITEEIERVKAEITSLKQDLSPTATRTRHTVKQLVAKKKRVAADEDGWQTIPSESRDGDLHHSQPATFTVLGGADKKSENVLSNESVIDALQMEDDDGNEVNMASSVEEKKKQKAARKKMNRKMKKKMTSNPPIPGLIYV
eukprot:Blabericola_migrator_1__331@NODE_1084_length_5492_cov_106_716682_g643_i1_p2_GENE_NODE_1084_length_5492_cov_106_716682_g643_i1NODE_1084_length_5492_cov_106_716682_g643_i1_p2_ORF_typecomplete_len360_score56_33DUF5643/PF18705_1/0_06BcrAbl_Oligo/PF09036_10/2_7e03BcrAbl_Oligo/PF09036_10/0_15RRP7/PF12923_7/1_8e02RRP7/PF12923_7/0_029VPDSGCTERM/PF18205_1/0_53VPDSGCTERM/PF18205_1/2_2e03_NODE_1084_length_5492_cov_106_716682_g643_i116732752